VFEVPDPATPELDGGSGLFGRAAKDHRSDAAGNAIAVDLPPKDSLINEHLGPD
jgi:hypothetical protein